jgi:hypothetical protein
MKSLRNMGAAPAGIPILADDVLEFHAARLLLLIKLCGTGGRIDGLTKMAKLDFFVRYPQFFEEVRAQLADGVAKATHRPVESSMVRFHYGPWDKRYYHILGYLEAKGLLGVEREGPAYVLKLTEAGKAIATKAANRPAYEGLVEHMREVKKTLGAKSGSSLKDLVYRVFGEEVANRPIGERIE